MNTVINVEKKCGQAKPLKEELVSGCIPKALPFATNFHKKKMYMHSDMADVNSHGRCVCIVSLWQSGTLIKGPVAHFY